MPHFEDEDLPVASKTAAAVTAAATAAINAANNDLDVDWGDTDAMAHSGLDRIKPEGKTRYRLAVIGKTVKKGWMHYIPTADGKKMPIRCLTQRDSKNRVKGDLALCCKKYNNVKDAEAQLVFAAIVVHYLNPNPETGKYSKPAEGEQIELRWELAWLKLSRSGFKEISNMMFEGEAYPDFDFVMYKKDPGVGYDYGRLTKGGPLYKGFPELVAEIEEAAKSYEDGVFLTKQLGKVLTELDLKAMISGKAAGDTKAGETIDDTADL